MAEIVHVLPAILIPFILLMSHVTNPEPPDNPLRYRIMFYNTENLFDTRDDSLTDDNEFTPQGAMHWTYNRYNAKLISLFKTIIAVGGWQPPDVIGLCEVENEFVLSDLLNKTPLLKYPYRIIHANSPDRRGIDVAAVYNSKTVRVLRTAYLKVGKADLFTRDILYFKAVISRDTCHFFMNHWPSRSSGQLRKESNRFSAASRLSQITDSLLSLKTNARIIIMGDLNDEPEDPSIMEILKAKTELSKPGSGSLYNLSVAPDRGPYLGTIKFRGNWSLFDQIIVSGSLMAGRRGLYIMPDGYRIFGASFLLSEDKKYNGFQPFRTYNGYKYQGGFSDHLPVYADLYVRDN